MLPTWNETPTTFNFNDLAVNNASFISSKDIPNLQLNLHSDFESSVIIRITKFACGWYNLILNNSLRSSKTRISISCDLAYLICPLPLQGFAKIIRSGDIFCERIWLISFRLAQSKPTSSLSSNFITAVLGLHFTA